MSRRTTTASGTLPWKFRLKGTTAGDTCKRAVPWVGARVAWINGSNAVRTPVSDPLVRARVHAYAKRQWRDRRTGTSRPLGPPVWDGAHSSIW